MKEKIKQVSYRRQHYAALTVELKWEVRNEVWDLTGECTAQKLPLACNTYTSQQQITVSCEPSVSSRHWVQSVIHLLSGTWTFC